ncbi:MAG: adenylate/guanylate cyclase domain-containing protein [Cyanobacteriota bacterium]|nr:adenylate/guanylate cyclase domain-containing protein [Cyanobacteriota bacterium]
MRVALKPQVWLPLGLLLITGILYARTQTFDFEQHDQFVGHLHRLRELDARFAQEELAWRYGQPSDELSLTDVLQEMQQIREKIVDIPRYISRRGKLDLSGLLEEYKLTLEAKQTLSEDLQNRIRDQQRQLVRFVDLVEQITTRQPDLRNPLNNLHAKLLVIAYQPGGEQFIPLAQLELSQIQSTSISPDKSPSSPAIRDKQELGSLVNQMIANQPIIEQLSTELMAVPSLQGTEVLIQEYITYCTEALTLAAMLRIVVYLNSLILVIMVAAAIIWSLRQSTAALREAEAKFRGIFDHSLEGIYQLNEQGIIVNANLSLAKILGFGSPQELLENLDQKDPEIYVDPGRRDEFFAKVVTEGSVSDFESQIYRRDGSVIWISEHSRAIFDRQKRLVGYEGMISDITARKQAEECLKQEREKTERLLLNILPAPIIAQLKENTKFVAEKFEIATILFADIAHFTDYSAQISPTELVEELNQIFTIFDQLAEWHHLEKIKTIGDAYMVVGGIPVQSDNHAIAIAEMALDMQQAIQQFPRKDGQPFHLRIGIHTGTVVAGVIGSSKLYYDLWGDAVNMASRMESHGVVDEIQISQETYYLLQDRYLCEERGSIVVKGKGKLLTYFLKGRRFVPTHDFFDRQTHPRIPVVSLQEAASLERCGVQRPGFPLSLGVLFEERCYYFDTILSKEFSIAQYQAWERTDQPKQLDETLLLVENQMGYRLYVNYPHLKVFPYQAGLASLCSQMYGSSDVEIMDRRWGLRVFQRCFVGCEAVTWLANNLQRSRQEAVEIGQDCLEAQLFAHVLGEQDFADDHYFYRFRQDGIPQHRVIAGKRLLPTNEKA